MKDNRLVIKNTAIFLTLATLVSAALLVLLYMAHDIMSDHSYDLGQLEAIITANDELSESFSSESKSARERAVSTAALTASAIRECGINISEGRFGDGRIVKRPKSDPDQGVVYTDEGALTYARIKGSYYYEDTDRDARSPDEILKELNIPEALGNVAEADGCEYILFSPYSADSDPGDMLVMVGTGVFSDVSSAAELGLTPDRIYKAATGMPEYIKAGGTSYMIRSEVSGPDNSSGIVPVMLIDMHAMMLRALDQALPIILIMLSICLVLAVWIISIRRLVMSTALSYDESSEYYPAALKRRIRIFVIAGTVAVFFSSLFIQSFDDLFMKSDHAERALEAYFDRLDDDAGRNRILEANRRDVYIRNAWRIASLLDEYPELLTNEWLSEASYITGSEYITIYDTKGREVVSSSPYRGLSLGSDKESPTYDFRRLLNGAGFINHDKVLDEMSGHRLSMYGISLDLEHDADAYGALLIAVDTDRIVSGQFMDQSTVASSIVSSGDLLFGIDPGTSGIEVCSDPDLIDSKAADIGIDGSHIVSGYTGSLRILGREYYARSSEYKENIYYYAAGRTGLPADYMIDSALPALLFLIMALMLINILLSDYSAEDFAEEDAAEVSDTEEAADEETKSRLSAVLPFLDRNTSPEQKALGLGKVLLLICVISIFQMRVSHDSASTLLDYLVHGEWERGFNIYAYTAILYSLCALIVILMVLRFLSFAVSNLFDRKSRTISLLLISMLGYGLIIVFVFTVLACLGVNTRAMLASAGLAGLAISIGAKDLVADVLAGFTTIIEGTYHVGEVIEIDGFKGEVMKLSMRSTTVMGLGQNIKTFRNSNIMTVINYSRMNSWYPLNITFSNSHPLSEVEELLKRELPEIGRRHDEIISGPEYRGVDSISGDRTTVLILTECRQADIRWVQRTVNREVRILLEKHDISML